MVVRHHQSKRMITLKYTALMAAAVVAAQFTLGGISLSHFAVTAYQNLADVSQLSVSVPETPINALAQQFDQKEKELTAREEQLLEREKDLDAKYQESIEANKRLTLYVLIGVTVLLLVLIFLNFYFDIKREEERERNFAMNSGPQPPSS